MIRSIALPILLVVVFLAGCRSSQEHVKDTVVRNTPAEPGPGVPPSHCRIIGTIVAIDQQTAGDQDDACSKAPCTATVRVEEILGYGSGFTEVLGKGKEIKVRFRYTLSPSAGLFPQMAPALPGLEMGSKFQTDLLQSGPSVAGSTEPGFVAEQYQRK